MSERLVAGPGGRRLRERFRKLRLPLLLLLVLLVAASFRLQGFRWDAACAPDPETGQVRCTETHLHPDERFLTMVASGIELPQSVGQYLDTAESPANPRNRGYGFYPYGISPVLLTRVIAEALDLTGYDRIHLVGRALSTACSLLTVGLVFLLGRRLFDPTVGLLAALLLALAVLPIQQAHFFTVDAMATTLGTAALLAALGIAERGRWRDYGWFGLALGAAVAVKVSVVSLSLLAVAAAVHREWTRRSSREASPAARWQPITTGLALAAAVSLLVFRLLEPYAFTGPGLFDLALDPRWLGNLREVGELVGGWRDFPPGHQWADRTPLWFPWRNMVLVGLGPALGLAAWIGWALALPYALRRSDRRILLPWLWVAVLFLHQGTQWVKSMRYLLPIYPALALFAAWLLVVLWRTWGRQPGARRLLAVGIVASVLGTTLAWAWAFTSIYRRPHSRIEASRWIYEHVPPGAAITHEVWDDPLPSPLDGRPGMALYQGLPMHPYAEDTPAKLEEMLDVLDGADYVVLSSNRVYDSIARLPMRYPMTMRYYDLLFSGALGYERVAEFTSYPRLFGLEIPDQWAEEAFSVYDHPRVQIFARTPKWSREHARALLDRDDWDEILTLTPRQASRHRSLRLPPELANAQAEGGRWTATDGSGLFPPDRRSAAALLLWVTGLQLLGMIGFLLCRPALRGLFDGGWLVGKTLGLLLLAFSAWLAASLRLLPFTPSSLRGLLLGLGVAALLVLWRQRASLAAWLRSSWRPLLGGEILFWAFFTLLLLVRWLNPDLWHPHRGGEKPMDLAYFNAVVRSTFFPPYDPWFAGGWLNYYYFGFVLSAVLTLLVRVPTEIAYNLAVPTFFALTAAGACTVVATLARWRGLRRPVAWGAGGAVALLAVGNLGTVRLLLDGARRLSEIDFPSRIPLLPETVQTLHGMLRWLSGASPPIEDHHWYWSPSRAIPHPPGEPPPITEFPLFTFLFADLHAHLMALPVTVLVLALLTGWLRRRASTVEPPTTTSWREEALLLALLSLATGSLAAINTWDLPTFLGITALGLLLAAWARFPLPRAATRAAAGVLVVAVVGRLLFAPFHRFFTPGYGRVVPWAGSETPLIPFLWVHALFLVPIGLWLLLARKIPARLRRQRRRARLVLPAWRHPGRPRLRRRRPRHSRIVRWDRVLEGWGLVLAALLLVAGQGLEALVVAVGALAAGLVLDPRSRPENRWVAAWVVSGGALALAVEHLVLAGDVGRMNTVFKSYLQIWTLWSLAATWAVAVSWRAVVPERAGAAARSPVPRPWRRVVVSGWLILLAGALAYPLLAVPARVRDRFETADSRGLDGSRFLSTAVYHDERGPLPLRWDAGAIAWLRRNVEGTPVVLEASVPIYRWGSRISIHTGLPTVLGWDWHQRQQRAILPGDPIGERAREVARIYEAAEVDDILPILERHRVRYVVVGALERLYHPGAGLEKFARSELFREVYRNPGIAIYELSRSRRGAGSDQD